MDADNSTIYRLTGEVILTLQQDYRNQKWVQDETAGVLIDDNDGIIETIYQLHDGITGLTGKLNTYRNNYQFIPTEDPGAASSSGNTPTAVERTLAGITPDDQGRLVQITDLAFDEKHFETNFQGGKNYDVSDASGPGVFRTEYREADFIGSPVPETPRTILAIVHMYFETIQIVGRSASDLQLTELASIRALRNQEPGTDTEFTLVNEVVLTFQQAYRNQKWVQDETAGILIDDQSGVLTTDYAINDGITGLKFKLGIYRDNLQILPLEDPGAPTSSDNEPVVVERTLEEITPDDQGRLVLIKDLSFDESLYGQNFATGKSYDVSDDTGALVFRTEFYNADYIGTPIPVVPQNLTAIVHLYFETIQVVARSLDDFEPAGEVPSYTVTFTITDEGGDPLEGAQITLGEEAYEAGQYVLEGLLPGTYTYNVSLEGYHDATGQVVLVSEDLEVEVMLIAVDPDMVTEFPWNEGFEGDFPPAGWKLYSASNDEDAGQWTTHATAHSGSAAAHHTFSMGASNSWLVSPQVQLPEDEVMLLSFFERNALMGDYGYSGVWISAGSGNPFNEDFVELRESPAAAGSYTQRFINLTDYKGKVVYFAFVYQGEDAHQWWVDDVAVEQAPDVFDMPDIATLVAEGLTDGTVYRITGEVIITHLQQAYRGQLYLQDESAAILVDDSQGVIETAYEVYDGITGFTATLTMFQDMYQLVPEEDPGAPSSSGNTVEPLEVTLSQLTPEIQGMLVIVRDVTFKEGSPATFTHNQSYYILDPTGEGEIRTPNSAGLLDYFGTDVPDEPKDIIGVLHQRYEVLRLQPRSLADFLTPTTSVPEVEMAAVRLFPNPASDRVTLQSDRRMDHVRVFDLSGRLRHSQRVDDTEVILDTGGLTTGLYLIQVVAGGQLSTHRLQINR